MAPLLKMKALRGGKKTLPAAALFCCLGLLLLTLITYMDLRPLPSTLCLVHGDFRKAQIVDRDFHPLTYTYQNRWNLYDIVPLHRIPDFLQMAFVVSEDKRFFRHSGVDWPARLHALWQNTKTMRTARGASTITEQVVRMLHPRPRTFWSRWLEGFEAGRLEKRCSKADILEFYLNQVPYTAQRRGVVQAARYYFDRDLDTLSHREMLALAVLVRAPSRLDLYASEKAIEPSIKRLAVRINSNNPSSGNSYKKLIAGQIRLAGAELPVEASHFVEFVAKKFNERPFPGSRRVHTSLDSSLQARVQDIINQRLRDLKNRNVHNAGALVVDHQTNKILAWVVGKQSYTEKDGTMINSVLALRQPGSTLKPFLYALALEKGWTAASVINDTPLSEPVSTGLHTYHNYSRTNYGPVTLREALGNSLNIPAVRAIQFAGVPAFLKKLHLLGVESLKEHPDFYGDGLALGNGEISLFELVQAYSVLGRQGFFMPISCFADAGNGRQRRVFSPEITSIIGNILSDPGARLLEFGSGSLLRFPLQTAVKTGTSSDYRDAWAIGYNYRYTFGVWMGNLNNSPMDEVTGSLGPALALRSIASELTKHQETRPLYLSPKLVKKTIDTHPNNGKSEYLPTTTEWFLPGTEPPAQTIKTRATLPRLLSPTNGLFLAMDPRIPDQDEAFEFAVSDTLKNEKIEWLVDDKPVGRTSKPRYTWPLKRGTHTVRAIIVRPKNNPKTISTRRVSFTVS